MDQSKKILLAVVLLVIAAGLFAWHFKPRKVVQTEEPQSVLLATSQAKALEGIFSKVRNKKWTDPSLWTNSKAASTYGAVAERLFTAKPSMDDVTILNYGTIKENDDAPFLILQVPTTDVCIQVEFKPTKGNQMVIENIFESQVKVKDYKK